MKRSQFLIILYSVGWLMSCTDTISVNIAEGETQLVVDGEITDQPGPYLVKLSETVGAYTSDSMPPVRGARVVISDNKGTVDTLQEVAPGSYQTHKLVGQVGNRYSLRVTTEKFGSYWAQSEIRPSTRIDSLYAEYQEFFPGSTSDGYLIKYDYTDLPGEGDRFRAKIYQNDKLLNQSSDLVYMDDQYTDGKRVTDAVASRKRFVKGDRVTLVLLSLTADAYEFIRQMDTQTNNSGLLANPPANVRTNISNADSAGKKAVGYFFCSALTHKDWIVN